MGANPRIGEHIPENQREVAIDEQTGNVFALKHESKVATTIAGISAVYLLAALGFLLWLLFDTWSRRNLLLSGMGYDQQSLDSGTFRLLAFTAIAGGLGGTVDGLRSLISWHSEREAYGPRFIWRDLALPPLGATIGLMAYMALRGGVGVVSGDFSLDQTAGTPVVSAFALASVAGFSSRQVFRWIDAQANRIFSVTAGSQAVVPNLAGKTESEAKALLQSWKLTLGASTQTAVTDDGSDSKVLQQSPAAGTVVPGGSPVAVTVGKKDPTPTEV